MSQEKILEIRQRLFHLDRKIVPLEWDASRNQINEFKKMELERLKGEHTALTEELNQLQHE